MLFNPLRSRSGRRGDWTKEAVYRPPGSLAPQGGVTTSTPLDRPVRATAGGPVKSTCLRTGGPPNQFHPFGLRNQLPSPAASATLPAGLPFFGKGARPLLRVFGSKHRVGDLGLAVKGLPNRPVPLLLDDPL